MKRNKFKLVLIIVVVALLIFIGCLKYKSYLSPVESGLLKNVRTPGYVSKASLIDSSNLTRDWKTYTNSNPYYSLKYPSDWVINSSDADLTSSTQNAILSIMKGEVAFRVISIPLPISKVGIPEICNFSPGLLSDLETPSDQSRLSSLTQSVEIKSGDYVYRVITPPIHSDLKAPYYFQVCFKNAGESNKFTTRVGGRQIEVDYKVPEKFDDKDVDTMNLILSTLKFTK